MPSTKDLVIGAVNQYLFVGPNGTGKTLAAASFLKARPGARCYIFDFDGRLLPIRTKYPELDIEYDTYGAQPSSFMSLINKVNSFVSNCPYDLVIFDSITALSMTCVNYQLAIKGTGAGNKAFGGIKVPTWDEMNGEAMYFSQILDACKDIARRSSVIWTAHPVTKTIIGADGSSKGKSYESITCFGIKAPSIIPNYFNEIYSFDVKPSVLETQPPLFQVRFRTDGLQMGKTALNLPATMEWTGKDFFVEYFKLLEAA